MRRLLICGLLSALILAAMPPDRARAAETLTWGQCLSEAASNHPDLRAAAAAVRKAEAQVAVDQGGLYPTVSISGSGNRSGNFTDGGGGSSLASTSSGGNGYWSAVASASQLLFDGGKTRNTISSDRETAKASQYAADVISSSTRYALRTAFVQLLTAQQQVKLAAEIVEIRRHSLRLIGLLYKSGSENIGSYSKAKADLAQAEFELAQAARGLKVAQAVLCTQLGRRNISVLAVSAPFTATESVGARPDFDQLVRDHPSFRQLAAQSEASRYGLEAARSAFVPKVTLSSSVGNSAFPSIPPERINWLVGFNVSVPIYQGGTGKATVAMARASLNQFAANEESGYLSLLRTLEQSWKNFRDAAENVDVQKLYLAAAAERAKISDAQYSSGLVTFNDWTIIEDNLVSAKKSYLTARSTLLTAEAAWVQAKGGTFEETR